MNDRPTVILDCKGDELMLLVRKREGTAILIATETPTGDE
jgi:hypothetical protein